jgi:hypothetical protein
METKEQQSERESQFSVNRDSAEERPKEFAGKCKDKLINNIKDWVKIDNELKILQKETVQRKNEKKKLSLILIEIMRENNIDCFDINNGQLIYNKRNVKKPISQKELFNILSKYFEGDNLKASNLNEFILNSRIEIVKEDIIRKTKDN